MQAQSSLVTIGGPVQRLILPFGNLGPGHFGGLPFQVPAQQSLNRLAQLRHHHVGQTQTLPELQERGQAEARVGPYAPQSHVTGQVLPQVQKEPHRIAPAGGVARAQPELYHQAHFGQHRQQRIQTRLEPPRRVPDRHAFLMPVFVEQPRRVQVQRVAPVPTR